MKTVIEMAHETLERMNADEHCREQYWSATDDELQAFAELVRADEREAAYKRRGVFMFDPYSGAPRHPSDIQSDPHAILLLDPEQPIRGLRINT